MFAFGIWDKVAGELFLARDAYGIKPLYYARTGSGFAFASQVKALQASGLIAKVVEPAAVAAFYLWGSISEPWTVNRGVFALPAGHWLRVRDGTSDAPVGWTDVADEWIPSTHRYDGDLAEHVRTSVTDSIRAHLVSDVPVCIFLSAGIDSAVLAGLTAQLGANVEAVTVGFDEFVGRSEDEVPVAVAAAAHYGLPHTVRRVSVAEFEADVSKVLEAMDQPSVDGINTWFASKAAAERGFKVALSGIGGDELFCGYSSFRQVPQAAAAARVLSLIPGGRALLQAGCDQLAKNPRRAKMAALPQMMSSVEGLYFLRRALFIPQELPALMGVEGARAALERLGTVWGRQRDLPRHAVSAVARLESTQYLRNQLLRDSDWSSMAHSLELRTPLVDHTLLRALGPFVPRFVGGSGKRLLAEVPAKPLPDTILHRRKTGFALPMAEWLRKTHSGSAPWVRTWAASVLKAAACG
jgi:asparagine synthase (glutamine-hydrolysing)